MKLYTVIFFILLTPLLMQSQTYEIGGFVGGANFIGDVGSTSYIAPKTPVIGALFKWNRSERHAFRGSITFARIEGDDQDSHESRRNERDYKFENNLIEVSVGIEFTFWEFEMYSGKPASAPYLYTGITYFRYNSLIKKSNNDIVEYNKAGSFSIPMTVGYKTTLGRRFILAGEIGARYTFTDNLDGSNPRKGSEEEDLLSFGNQNNNDWYVFTGISLTYTFGRKPCYCNF
ncbi:MAG: DUF6089 family protein [Flavobacteriaceae bacterium]|nr:DUF6089 family protein [Flavobacteriaceae bacterium]